jgi:beta-lactamase class A
MRAGARRAAGLFAGVLLLLFCGVCGARAQDADAPIPVPAPSTPLPLKPDPALQAKLQAMIGPYAGKVTLFAHDLGTGQTVAINADTPVPTASVIKLTILYEALEQIRAGKASWDEKLTLTKAEQVPGSGVLLFFDTPLTITLKDAITMMIVMSDNTATNLVIDRLGIQNIDSQIQALGLKNTWLYKRIMLPPTGPMPADQKQFGLGKTTAREMATVLTRFVTCELGPYVGPGAGKQAQPLCDTAMHMLGNQFYRDGLPRYLDGSGLRIANKTGALDHVRNDVGVVYTRTGPVVMSEFTYDNTDISWTSDNTAELLLARLSRQIVDSWQQGGSRAAQRIIPREVIENAAGKRVRP